MNKVEGIKSSIDKWKRIRDDLRNHAKKHYVDYFDTCGYCLAFEFCCYECPLRSMSRKYGVFYCQSNYFSSSLASAVLREAGRCVLSLGGKKGIGDWNIALEKTKVLLAKMRRDLKKYKRIQ